MPVLEDLPEFESRLIGEISRGIEHCWMQYVDRMDELIGLYYSIALNIEQDFDEALRAAHVMLELIEMRTTLLKSYVESAP